MAYEEKFANALDRFLFPFIDQYGDWNELDGNDEWIGNIGLKDGRTMKVRQVLEKSFTTTIHVGDELVYERRDGWTHCLRPGDWCVELYEYAKARRDDEEMENLCDAIESAKKKAIAFEPV